MGALLSLVIGEPDERTDEEVIGDTVLRVTEVKDRYRHLKAIQHGYVGLGLFLVFMFYYCWVLSTQHRLDSVGEVNVSFQILFEKFKTDLVVGDIDLLYKHLGTVVVPKLLGTEWKGKTKSGEVVQGRTTNEFYHVLGGLILTVEKSPFRTCFRGNPCFSEEALDDPFYTIRLPGDAGNFSVPYNKHFKGYSIALPSSTEAASTTKLMAAYVDLFGPDTRGIWVDAVVFNPSGYKTVTSIGWGGTLSVHNNIDFFTKLLTVPYHWYNPESTYFQLFMEIVLVVFAVRAFVWPLLRYRFGEPELAGQDLSEDLYLELRTKWLEWVNAWHHLPVKGGRLLWQTPTILYLVFFVTIFFWLNIGHEYRQLSYFSSEHLDPLFQDPISESSHDLKQQIADANAAMHKYIMPITETVESISSAFNKYFFLHVVVMTLMVQRLNEYFMFQKRLSMVSDTFSGIFDDLLHMGLVLIVICFFFGVLNSLAFGAYDRAFQNFLPAFWEMGLVCFGLFKPAAASPFVASLFKYTPHVVTTTQFMSWVPLLLAIMFKTIVVMLLFKLLMGVIMESYKKHAKLKAGASTVRQDLNELSALFYQSVWCHLVKKQPYVSLFQVTLALANTKPDKDKPWQEDFLGLESPQSVKEALNNVLTTKDPRVRALVEVHHCKEVGDPELAFVLRAFGTNRERAESLFKKSYLENQRKIITKQDALEAKTVEKQKKADCEKLFKDALKNLRHEQRPLGVHEVESGSPLDDMSTEALQEAFDEFDFLNIGTVDHRLMPQLFKQIGIVIGTVALAKLLADFDHNEDGDASFKEFEGMLRDERLIGLYKKKPRQSTAWRKVKVVATATQAARRVSAAGGTAQELNQRLLAAGGSENA